MHLPVVAVPAFRVLAEPPATAARLAAPEPYLAAIARAGGRPVLVVPTGMVEAGTARPGEAEDLLRRVDALVLPGGADLDPARYGASRHPSTGEPDPDRDGLELALAAAAFAMGVPTLAICRGFQVLNVALGGTLHQHLPDRFPLDHGREGDVDHRVDAEPGSRLATVCGSRIERCASHHHQGVDALAEALAPVGWSEDSLVEAAEPAAGAGSPWLMAVQWHPERSAERDPVQQALFDALVARARD